jgi:hypothetical protein
VLLITWVKEGVIDSVFSAFRQITCYLTCSSDHTGQWAPNTVRFSPATTNPNDVDLNTGLARPYFFAFETMQAILQAASSAEVTRMLEIKTVREKL